MVSLNEQQLKELAIKLYEISGKYFICYSSNFMFYTFSSKLSAFKFGDFKMKVGINSPVYFDLRVIVAHPELMVKYNCL